MKYSLTRRFSRIGLGATVLVVGLLFSPLSSHSASAYISGCDTDPVVYLSDGTAITLVASINDQVSDVMTVNYTVHVPSGVSVTNISYDSFGYLESVSVIPDEPANQYATDTTVYTYTPWVRVTDSTAVSGFATKSASGYSWQRVHFGFSGN
jgi:hypothetical protein